MYYLQLYRSLNKSYGESKDYETLICGYAEYYASMICNPITSLDEIKEYMKPTSIYYTKIFYVEKEDVNIVDIKDVLTDIQFRKIGKVLDVDNDLDREKFIEKYNYWVDVYQNEVYGTGLLPYWCDDIVTFKQLYLSDFPFPFDIKNINCELEELNCSDKFKEYIKHIQTL